MKRYSEITIIPIPKRSRPAELVEQAAPEDASAADNDSPVEIEATPSPRADGSASSARAGGDEPAGAEKLGEYCIDLDPEELPLFDMGRANPRYPAFRSPPSLGRSPAPSSFIAGPFIKQDNLAALNRLRADFFSQFNCYMFELSRERDSLLSEFRRMEAQCAAMKTSFGILDTELRNSARFGSELTKLVSDLSATFALLDRTQVAIGELNKDYKVRLKLSHSILQKIQTAFHEMDK